MNQEDDQLLHLYWKERKTQASHEEVKKYKIGQKKVRDTKSTLRT
jgi:hypothetical protein